jgi:hypothetical protein
MKIALFHTTLPKPGRKLGAVVVATRKLANTLLTTRDKENESGGRYTVSTLLRFDIDATS